MKRTIIILLLVFPLLLLAVGAVRAAIEAYELTWFTVDVGGGNSQGGNYALSGTVAQPDAGPLSGGSYALSGGFWLPAGKRIVYLPTLTRLYPAVFWETEPNNDNVSADGPLNFGVEAHGFPNDTEDYFYFDLSQAADLTIDLFDHTGTDVQLLLYNSQLELKGQATIPPHYQISFLNAPLGKYYVRIFTASGYNSTYAYRLSVTQTAR
jgi:hypothetical protein